MVIARAFEADAAPGEASGAALATHEELEAALIVACAAARQHRRPLALARIHVDPGPPPAAVERLLARVLGPGDRLAAYGPLEYTALLLAPEEPGRPPFDERAEEALGRLGIAARCALARWPRDGTAPQPLLTAACQGARPKQRMFEERSSRLVVIAPDTRVLYELARRAAAGDQTVLILGEAGVGKEILAQNVHRLSRRAQCPFLVLGADALGDGDQLGTLLRSADGGTVFVDAIDEQLPAVVAELLNLLERRAGGGGARPIDVRLTAAATRPHPGERSARPEVAGRLGAICLDVPPLRERRQEIELLARFFLQRVAHEAGLEPPVLTAEALVALEGYAWPGNIRELRNVIERAHVLCDGASITTADLPLATMGRSPWPLPPSPEGEREALLDALARCHGDERRAADLLGLPAPTFRQRGQQLGIARS
jgi:transcriptional regulator with AAA-type ATPase domain